MQSIYWREDQESNSKEGKSLEMEAEKLNSFILKAAMEGDQLSSTSSLNQAEFFTWIVSLVMQIIKRQNHRSWGGKGKMQAWIDEEDLCTWECGGGILFSGVDLQTHRVEGIKLKEDGKQQILQDLHLCQNQITGKLIFKKKFVLVLDDPFTLGSARDLYILRI